MYLFIWQYYCDFEENNVFTVLTMEEHIIQSEYKYNDELYAWHIGSDGTKQRLIKEVKI